MTFTRCDKPYIGTKMVAAQPMTRQEYNDFRGWQLPEDENGADEGYLVEYLDGGKPNVPTHTGYVSWSPKWQFENAYEQTDGLSFGMAIDAMRMGFKVSRKGWNGKGMWLIYVPGTPKCQLAEGSPYQKALNTFECEILPHIDMWTVNSEGRRAMLPGWLASQTDMLAHDWQLVLDEQQEGN